MVFNSTCSPHDGIQCIGKNIQELVTQHGRVSLREKPGTSLQEKVLNMQQAA